jgi:uncharacterized protein
MTRIEMKIDLTELLCKVGNESDVEEAEESSYPEDNLNLTKPVRMKLHFVNSGTMVILNGKIETEAELQCSRCLKKFSAPLLVKIKEDFAKYSSLPRSNKGGELELHDEDFVFPIEKDNTIDISEVIRQNLLLALPSKPLCSAKCQGLKG